MAFAPNCSRMSATDIHSFLHTNSSEYHDTKFHNINHDITQFLNEEGGKINSSTRNNSTISLNESSYNLQIAQHSENVRNFYISQSQLQNGPSHYYVPHFYAYHDPYNFSANEASLQYQSNRQLPQYALDVPEFKSSCTTRVSCTPQRPSNHCSHHYTVPSQLPTVDGCSTQSKSMPDQFLNFYAKTKSKKTSPDYSRRRIAKMNGALDELRAAIPVLAKKSYPARKPTKIETLRRAIEYIKHLRGVIDNHAAVK